MPSRTADEIIAKAQECYALDLITEEKLEEVTRKAETEPGYDPIMDLPFDWHIEHERNLRKAAALEPRRFGRLRARLQRFWGEPL